MELKMHKYSNSIYFLCNLHDKNKTKIDNFNIEIVRIDEFNLYSNIL